MKVNIFYNLMEFDQKLNWIQTITDSKNIYINNINGLSEELDDLSEELVYNYIKEEYGDESININEICREYKSTFPINIEDEYYEIIVTIITSDLKTYKLYYYFIFDIQKLYHNIVDNFPFNIFKRPIKRIFQRYIDENEDYLQES